MYEESKYYERRVTASRQWSSEDDCALRRAIKYY